MSNPLDMTRDEFIEQLEILTDAQHIYDNAYNIYGVLNELFDPIDCRDSLLREWAFQWATDELGISYDDIYQRFLSVTSRIKRVKR